MTPHDNPLLEFAGLPRFDRIAPEHVTPAIDHLIATTAQPGARRHLEPSRPTGTSVPRRSPTRSTGSTARGRQCGT